MCAISSVQKPRISLCFITPPMNTKRRARETPVTISGLVIGIFVTERIALCILLLILWIPTAAMVPTTVATIDAITAIITVFSNRLRRVLLLKSSVYHFVVNPVKCTVFEVELKEKNISNNIGRYRMKNIMET